MLTQWTEPEWRAGRQERNRLLQRPREQQLQPQGTPPCIRFPLSIWNNPYFTQSVSLTVFRVVAFIHLLPFILFHPTKLFLCTLIIPFVFLGTEYISIKLLLYLIQFSSVAQSCLTLCDSTDCSIPGFPVHHQLLELAQTHVHQVGNAIQTSHLLSSPCPAFNLSQHQSLFQ